MRVAKPPAPPITVVVANKFVLEISPPTSIALVGFITLTPSLLVT